MSKTRRKMVVETDDYGNLKMIPYHRKSFTNLRGIDKNKRIEDLYVVGIQSTGKTIQDEDEVHHDPKRGEDPDWDAGL